MAKSAPEIIAFHLMWDIGEVSEGRYQRYASPAVYVCGKYYFCCPTSAQKPPSLAPRGAEPTEWEKVATYYGRDVYRTAG